MFEKLRQKIAEGYKAVVAVLVPIAFGAAVEMLDALAKWVTDAGYVWGGVAAGLLTGAGVWLKRNRPPS